MERPYLFVSDVDDTLLGDDAALERFAKWYDERRGSLRLAYNSGRFPESVQQSIAEMAMPQPDAIIGGVGTDIYLTAPKESLANWPPQGTWNLDTVWSVLHSHKELTPQPDEFQSRYKASCFGEDLPEEFVALLREQLRSLGVEAEVVYSSHINLDVLPKDANKGTAVAHLAKHWDILPERVLVAGDSGNDLAMFQHGFLGIVVANSHEELKALRGDRVFIAAKTHAAGVIEGLHYWLERID